MRGRRLRLPVKPFASTRSACSSSASSRCSAAAREPPPAPSGRRAAAARVAEPAMQRVLAIARQAAAADVTCCSPARAAPARTCSRGDPRLEPARDGPVRHHRLHDARRASARERALRPREGRVHRRVEGQAGPPRGGARAARSSSTRSASCRSSCRRSCCASSRSAASSASADDATIEVDVRVIAATNRDLEAEVARGPLPRGPLLPPERDRHPSAAAARAARRPGAACRPPARRRSPPVIGRPGRDARRRGARARFSPTTGPATSASW